MSEPERVEEEEGEDFDGEGSVDRRVDYRHIAALPAQVETPAGTSRSALVRDLSISGTLLLTRARLRVGDRVKLSLYLNESSEPFVVAGEVVRHETRTAEMAHPWTKSVAIRFEAPVPDLEAAARALAERQAELLGRKPSTPPGARNEP